ATATGILVAGADFTGVNAVLHAADTVSGRVTSAAGGSLQGISVQAYLGTAGVCCYFIRGTLTNADGFYSLDLLPGYDYKIRFAADTPQEQWWNGAANSGNNVAVGWSRAQSFQVSQAAVCSGNVTQLFNNWNIGVVSNGGLPPTFVTPGTGPYCLTEIDTYHWNNGLGATPGSISINRDGVPVGSWQATGSAGSNGNPNENWSVQFGLGGPVLQGPYTCGDSDHPTWAQNGASGGLGFCKLFGVPFTAATTGHPNTNAILNSGTISGVAQCGPTIVNSAILRSGGTQVAQQANLIAGAFAFAGAAP